MKPKRSPTPASGLLLSLLGPNRPDASNGNWSSFRGRFDHKNWDPSSCFQKEPLLLRDISAPVASY